MTSLRQAMRRLASVFNVLDGISTFICANEPSCVGVVTTGVATFGVGFPTLCTVASRGSSSLNVVSFGGVATIGVPTVGVGLSIDAHGVPRLLLASFGFRNRRCDDWRLFYNFVSNVIPRMITLNLASFSGVATPGRRFASIVSRSIEWLFLALFAILSRCTLCVGLRRRV
jgi:hypothetical protein